MNTLNPLLQDKYGRKVVLAKIQQEHIIPAIKSRIKDVNSALNPRTKVAKNTFRQQPRSA